MSCLPAQPGCPPLNVGQTTRRDRTIVTPQIGVVIGADTHLDTIHLAALDSVGKPLGDAEFRACPRGYSAAVAWARKQGTVQIAGVEGTSCYGMGLTAALHNAGIAVVEVIRPDRSARRRQGKSDPLDAYSAARIALTGDGLAVPKDEDTAAVRALLTARRGATKARTAAINQIKSLLVTAPVDLRERYRGHSRTALIRALSRCRPSAQTDTTAAAVLSACKAIAQRVEFLEAQDRELTAELDELVTALNPGLRAAFGVGPDTAAQLLITAGGNPDRLRREASFAALCGPAPVPASSGKTQRHRLSRGGDRAANSALHRIALVRMSSDKRTRAYVARQLANGRSKMEILRLLKRALAREVFRLLTTVCDVDNYSDLRPARQHKNITLTAAAQHFGVWPTAISRLERGQQRDDNLAGRYRDWLASA